MRWSALTTIVFSLLTMTAWAHDGGPSVAAPTLNRADVEAWLDGFLPYAMSAADIAGGVVAVVKDGEVVLQKGYGYADVVTKRPVDAERTLFRAGSVAKLVTHTAVMQQVEAGKLDLDQDIATYLDVPVPAAFGQPVTLRHLMTHTAGFEERIRSMIVVEPSALLSLDEYVRSARPSRMFAPGTVPSYCNYCAALEGYLVQRASGETFDDYVERHIFAPLGMAHSTFRQPLPERIAEDMSKGYDVASQPAQYFELISQAPAGSLSTSGADMAKFMIAHLQALRGERPDLLSAATAERMQTTMYRGTPPGLGMALGFFERDRNGRRVREHSGDTQFFHSSLLLFIDDGVGLFLSLNSSGTEVAAHPLREAMFDRFTDRYFPAPVPNEPTTTTAAEHARLLAGSYEVSRRAETTFLKLFTLLNQVRIVAREDGTLEVPLLKGANGQPKRWREVQPFVWREVDGKDRLTAQVQDGRVRMIGVDSLGGVLTFMPAPAGLSSTWLVPALIVSLTVMTLTVVGWPVIAARRFWKGMLMPFRATDKLARRTLWAFALLYVLFAGGWLFVMLASDDVAIFDGRLDRWFSLLHLMGLLGVVGAFFAVWQVRHGCNQNCGWKTLAWWTAIAVSAIFITWFGFAFNLIRFSVEY